MASAWRDAASSAAADTGSPTAPRIHASGVGRPWRALFSQRSPECAFWNMCLWNPFLHTYDYTYERVTINVGQVVYEKDGSWTIVVAAKDPGHPNWVSTAGHEYGTIWFRWFLPSETPAPLTTEVVSRSDVEKMRQP